MSSKKFVLLWALPLLLVALLLIGWGIGLRVTTRHSSGLVRFENQDSALMDAIEARRSGPANRLDEIVRMIHEEPHLLLAPGPFGELPLDRAVGYGMGEVVEHLLLDTPQTYPSQYLLKVAQDAHRQEQDSFLPYFAIVIPADKPQWYASQIEHYLQEWKIDSPSPQTAP